MAIQARHVSLLANLIPTIIFVSPSILMAAHGLILPMIFYNGVLIFSLLNGFSNRLWNSEINQEKWNNFLSWDFLRIKKRSETYIKKPAS